MIFVWLLGVRYQVEVLQDAVGDQELEVSLAERWSEDTELVGVGGSAEVPRPRAVTHVSYVDAGYAIALGNRVRLRRRPAPSPPALGAGAADVGAAGRRAGRAPAAASGRDRYDHRAEPAAQPADVRGPPRARPCRHRRRRRTSRRVLAVFALLVVAFVFLLVEGLGSSLNYFDTVDQAFAHRQSLGTQTFRLEGPSYPAPSAPPSTGSDFNICQGPHVVHVANTGSPPQLFQARIPVVVVGPLHLGHLDRLRVELHLGEALRTYSAQYPGRVKATTTGPAC